MYGYRADITFDGEKAIPGGALVLVEDGVIIGVEPGRAPATDGCQVTYEPGTTLLPGLVDTHSHLCGNNEPGALDRLPGLSPGQPGAAIEAALTAQLAAGVTTVRDLGDQQWAVADRHRQRPGGPAVVASGPPIPSGGGLLPLAKSEPSPTSARIRAPARGPIPGILASSSLKGWLRNASSISPARASRRVQTRSSAWRGALHRAAKPFTARLCGIPKMLRR